MTKPKPPPPPPDFQTPQDHYITTNLGLREIFQAWKDKGWTWHAIQRDCKKLDWKRLRKELRKGVTEDAIDKVRAHEASQMATRLIRHLELLRMVQDRAAHVIGDYMEGVYRADRLTEGEACRVLNAAIEKERELTGAAQSAPISGFEALIKQIRAKRPAPPPPPVSLAVSLNVNHGNGNRPANGNADRKPGELYPGITLDTQ